MNGVRQPVQAPVYCDDLIERIIQRLRDALNEDLPRGGDGGLTVIIDIAPVKRNDFTLKVTRTFS